MEENTFKKQLYLRIENDSFGFVTNEIHDIKESDILISEEEYNNFFDLQAKGKQFRLKEMSTGTGLFDYVEEYVPVIAEALPYVPTLEDRVLALEEEIKALREAK